MQPLSGNQRPDLLTALMNMSFALRLPREMASLQILLKSPTPVIFVGNATNPCVLLTFGNAHNPLCLPTQKRHLNVQTCSVPLSFLNFWLRNVLRATTACTFSTSQKSGPDLVCFVHFDLENVLRATTACTFSTSQLPKAVRTCGVLWQFGFENVLRATTACTFSTSQLPKVVREWCALYILTSKCASRHKRRAIFSSLIWPDGSAPAALASLLFDPPERNGESELTKSEGGRDVGPIDHWRGSNHQLVTCSTSWLVTCEEPSGEALQINATVVSSYQRHWHLEPQATFCSIFSQTLDTLIPVWSSLWTICAWESWFSYSVIRQFMGKNTVFSRLSHLFAHLHLLSSDFFDLLSCTLLFSLTLPVSAFHLSILSEVCLASQLPSMNIHAPPAKSHQIITGDFFIAL